MGIVLRSRKIVFFEGALAVSLQLSYLLIMIKRVMREGNYIERNNSSYMFDHVIQ